MSKAVMVTKGLLLLFLHRKPIQIVLQWCYNQITTNTFVILVRLRINKA